MNPKKNPLLTGEKTNWSIYGPKALKKEIERQAAIDGYDSASEYTVALLVFALEAQIARRKAEGSTEG
ncbi:MAG: hypothetical protein ACOZQL_10475 [Myxococcota bacterium]